MILWLYGRFIMFLDFCIVMRDCAYQLAKSFSEMLVPPEPKSIEGEVVAVFGTNRNIGRELAMQLALCGTKVACVDFSDPNTRMLAKYIKAHGYIAEAFDCNPTTKDGLLRTMNAIEQRFGPITMLFYCWGVPSAMSLCVRDLPLTTILNMTVVSHYWLIKHILPNMIRNKHGHIVFVASASGISGEKHKPSVSLAQRGVEGLFEATVEDLVKAKLLDKIFVTMAHLYPYIVTDDTPKNAVIPELIGAIRADDAAELIIDGVLQNQLEISIPTFGLVTKKLISALPWSIQLRLRKYLRKPGWSP